MITQEQVLDIAKSTLYLMIEVPAPLLIISLVVGLAISIFQTVTSIQEQTMTFVPKLIAVFLGIMLLGGWMMNKIVVYMQELWGNFSLYV